MVNYFKREQKYTYFHSVENVKCRPFWWGLNVVKRVTYKTNRMYVFSYCLGSFSPITCCQTSRALRLELGPKILKATRDIDVLIEIEKSCQHVSFQRRRHVGCFLSFRYLPPCFPCFGPNQDTSDKLIMLIIFSLSQSPDGDLWGGDARDRWVWPLSEADLLPRFSVCLWGMCVQLQLCVCGGHARSLVSCPITRETKLDPGGDQRVCYPTFCWWKIRSQLQVSI